MDTQLKKGLLEFCVLAVLRNHDSYGYQLIREISPLIAISESTLYPILRRMEEAGNIISYTEEYHHRLRKYFKLSEKGKLYLAGFKEEREQMIAILNFINEGGNEF